MIKKILLLTIGIAAIIAICFPIRDSINDFEDTVVTKSEQHLLTLANTHSEQISYFLENTSEKLDMFSLNPDLIANIKSGGFCDNDLLGKVYQRLKGVDYLYVMDSAGVVKGVYPQAEKLYGADCSARPTVKDVLLKFRGLSESSTVSRSDFGVDYGDQAVWISLPIISDNKFCGMVQAQVGFNTINSMIGYAKDSTVYSWIIDADGRVIAYPDTTFIGSDIYYVKNKQWPGFDTPAFNQLVDLMRKGQRGSMQYAALDGDKELRDTRQLGGFAPIEIGDMKWSTAVSVNYDHVSGPMKSYLTKLLIMGGVMLVIIISGSVFLFVVQRKNSLLNGQAIIAKKMREANGKLKEEIDIRKKTEKELQESKKKAERSYAEMKNVTEKLEDAYKQLMDASRKAGMAEVAIDVLHNVGNALNSVNISATLVTEKMENSEVETLRKISDMLKAHPDDMIEFLTNDPKGSSIPEFVMELSDILIKEREDVLQHLSDVNGSVEHIKEIVRSQQSLSKVSSIEMAVSPSELIESSTRIVGRNFEQYDIKLTCDYTGIDKLVIDKNKVLQILTNLIKNSKEALIGSETDDKELWVKFSKDQENVLIEVSDNGVGISKENLAKIFNHGFTTKSKGHGFGLHSAGLLAEEMGGNLIVESEGLGKGASFKMTLPFKEGSDQLAEVVTRSHL